jgi:hypothetical protein
MTPKITNIHVGDPVALRMRPAKNTPAAGPSCAPDCTKAENRPRLAIDGTARATAATLAGM